MSELKAIYRHRRRPRQWMDRRIALEEGTEAEYAHRAIKPGWKAMGKNEMKRRGDERTKSRGLLRARRTEVKMEANGIARSMRGLGRGRTRTGPA